MSTVGTIAKIATDVVGKAVHAATHPRETVATVTGQARGLAATIIGGSQETSGRDAPPTDAPPRPAAPNLRPVPPQEPTATEPKSPSRNAAHGGPGDDRVDDWREELDDETEVETPVGTTGAGPGFNPNTGESDLQQPDTEPLMDPSLTKAIKSESETMRKAADPDSEG